AAAPGVPRKLEEIGDGLLGERAGLPRGRPQDEAQVAGVVDAWQRGSEGTVDFFEIDADSKTMILCALQPEGGNCRVADAAPGRREGAAVGVMDGEAARRVDHPREAGESDIAEFADMKAIPGKVDRRRAGHAGWMSRRGRSSPPERTRAIPWRRCA